MQLTIILQQYVIFFNLQTKPNQTKQMTNQKQLSAMLKFAQLHDWGSHAYLSDATSALHLYDYCTKEMTIFHDMQSLKAWAGY